MQKKAHFIGICGVGMSATAKLLKDCGWEISGSDSDFYPPGSELVERYGITFSEGYRAENIPTDVDLVVVGKNAKLVARENEEVKAAEEKGVPVRSFPEVLEGLIENKQSIVVAGSYAKSTCTSLLAWCLMRAEKNPSYFLGAIPVDDQMDTAQFGEGSTFILEGDEYPASNWDSTSKFLYYHPHDVLLTSASHDHVNAFPTHEEYLTPFKTLLSLMPEDGLLVASADEESSLALARTHTGSVVLYGTDHSESSWTAQNVTYGVITSFDLVHDGKPVTRLETSLLGKHNVQNIVGMSALLLEKQLVTPKELAEGIKMFRGIRRRLDLLTEKSEVPVYEGFGSSYEKARAAFDAIRLHFPSRRLITVFEPHTFSWRNRDALAWYDDVFRDSSLVLIYEPATQGARTHKQLSQEEIIERVQKSGIDARAIHSEEDGFKILKKELSGNDVILLMTSGNLGGLIESIPKFTEQQFPNS